MNAPTTVIQQIHPFWFDWVTVFAVVIGPVLALFAQRVLDLIREKKNRRVELYLTIMSLRATWLHPDSLRALNSIDTIFSKKREQKIRDAWAELLRHTSSHKGTSDEEARVWNERLLDLRVDLYQLIGNAVKYRQTVAYIKNSIYAPQYHVDAELEQIQIRKQFAKAITDEGLKIVIAEPHQH
jgi:uncharacterized protein DUF6680